MTFFKSLALVTTGSFAPMSSTSICPVSASPCSSNNSFSRISTRPGCSKSTHALPAISKYDTLMDFAPAAAPSPTNSASMACFSMFSIVCVFPLPVWPYMNKAPTPPLSVPATRGAALRSYTSCSCASSSKTPPESVYAQCLTNILFKSACIWQLCTTAVDPLFTLTTSYSPRFFSGSKSGRFRAYTLIAPGALVSAPVSASDEFVRFLSRQRFTDAAKGTRFIRLLSRLSNI